MKEKVYELEGEEDLKEKVGNYVGVAWLKMLGRMENEDEEDFKSEGALDIWLAVLAMEVKEEEEDLKEEKEDDWDMTHGVGP